MPPRHRATALPLFAALLLITGCVERLITVKSTPAGALVYLNDEEVGRTPVTVPFRFYGVYDVRLEHEGDWVTEAEAAKLLGLSEDDVRQRVEDEKLPGREEDGQRLIRIYYAPLWTSQEAKGPWWEAPGPDLIGEAIPHNKVELEWHFTLEPVADKSSERLIDRAKQMRALIKQDVK